MKHLIVSSLCLLFLLSSWYLYDMYAGSYIDESKYLLEERIMSAILNEDWDAAEYYYNIIEEKWMRFKNLSEYFLDTATVNEAGEMMHKARYHIMTRDISNAAADTSELEHMLTYLHENEMLLPGNIF
ncbi:MAG: DUF4363 family protein [Bacillota bacterium]|nr:DUF4363 family protein [Bacillota bacterium]